MEKIIPSLKDARMKLEKAFRLLNYAKRNLAISGDEDIIYSNVYDSVRVGCEAILLLKGFRIKSSSTAHHYEVINAAKDLMAGELKNEFIRFQTMRKKRNKFEYGNLEGVSGAELKQAFMDAEALLRKVDTLIRNQGVQADSI